MTESESLPEHLQLTEGCPLETALSPLLSAAGVEQDAFVEAAGHLVRVQPTFKAGMAKLTPRRRIGSIRIGALRIDVLPRLAVREMVMLIRYALGGKIDSVSRTDLPTDKAGLEELLCTALADEATRIRQIGWSRQYERRRERLPVLRGRPDFLGSFPWDEDHVSSIVCTYHLLTGDNLDNRLLLAALETASLLDVTANTKRRLFEHRKVWSAIAGPWYPTIQDYETARSRYTRLSEHYRLVHNLGELLVLGHRPSAPIEAGGVTAGGFAIDMPWLFEKFVERLTAEIAGSLGMKVEAQCPDREALLDAKGGIYRGVRPDLVVYRGNRPVAVVDAKYKDYWPGRGQTDAPDSRVSNADIYQLFFYAQRLQHRYNLPFPPNALIVAPVPAPNERGGRRVVGEQYTEVTWRAGVEKAGHVRLVLVPVTDILRAMAARNDWAVQQSDFVSLFIGKLVGSTTPKHAIGLGQVERA